MAAQLVYSSIVSVDGYVADENRNFDWSEPSPEVHAFINDLERPLGTYLYGRRLYQVMLAWETLDVTGETDVMRDYAALWRAADKIVYSSTLTAVSSARTRIEPRFDPAAVRALKHSATSDLGIGGPTLASSALSAGLVDEIRMLVCPIVVGAGTACLPPALKLGLDLLDERRFDNGVVHLRYRVL